MLELPVLREQWGYRSWFWHQKVSNFSVNIFGGQILKYNPIWGQITK
jgi:hypothetical protein